MRVHSNPPLFHHPLLSSLHLFICILIFPSSPSFTYTFHRVWRFLFFRYSQPRTASALRRRPALPRHFPFPVCAKVSARLFSHTHACLGASLLLVHGHSLTLYSSSRSLCAPSHSSPRLVAHTPLRVHSSYSGFGSVSRPSVSLSAQRQPVVRPSGSPSAPHVVLSVSEPCALPVVPSRPSVVLSFW